MNETKETQTKTTKKRRASRPDPVTALTKVNKSATQKPTTVEYEKRINLTMELLLRGMNTSQILQYFTEETGIEVTRRTIENYISVANQKYKEVAEIDRQAEFNKQKQRLEDLYYQLYSTSQFKESLPVLKELSALQGISNSENGDMVPRKDLLRIMNQMATIVTHFVEDEDTITKIREGWATMTLV